MSENPPLKIIFIAGYGRGGTTLLDIALGQHPKIFGAGEITALARQVWENAEYCACGKAVPECAVWNEVIDNWRSRTPDDFLAEYGRSHEKIERLVNFERLFYRFWRSRKITDYLKHTEYLMREINAVSGCPIIVDSSKLPGRAIAMTKLPGLDLRVVHVVRDGRGVAWSMMKSYSRQVDKGIQKELRPKPLLYTAARWTIVNLAAEVLRLRLGKGKSIRVRYEDFVADPAQTIHRIVSLTGENSGDGTIGNMETLIPQHQVAGSRHRMNERITLVSDEGWKNVMPTAKKLAFTIACAPLLWLYNYPLILSKRVSVAGKSDLKNTNLT